MERKCILLKVSFSRVHTVRPHDELTTPDFVVRLHVLPVRLL